MVQGCVGACVCACVCVMHACVCTPTLNRVVAREQRPEGRREDIQIGKGRDSERREQYTQRSWAGSLVGMLKVEQEG